MRKKVLLCLAFFLLSYGMDVAAEEVVGENMVDTVEATEAEETLPILPEAVFGEATTDEADMPTIDPEEDDEEEVVDRTDVTDTTDASDGPPEEVGEENVTDTPAVPKEEAAETVLGQDILYNVSLPADSTAYLDPGNISGRGQIFSEQYKVENYGNTDISIKIKDIDIYCKFSERLYEFSENEIADSSPSDSIPSDNSFVDSDPAVKKLHVEMVWKNENGEPEKVLNVSEGVADEDVLHLKAAEYDDDGGFVELNDGGTGSFFFRGTVDPDPGLVWEDGEIVIRFNYEIVNTDEEEEPEEDSVEAIGETAPEDIAQMPEEGITGTIEDKTVPGDMEERPKESTEGTAEDETTPGNVEEKSEESISGAAEDGTATGNTNEKPGEGAAGVTEGETAPENAGERPENGTDTGEKEEKPENGGDTEDKGEKPEMDEDTGEKEDAPEKDPAGAGDMDAEIEKDQGVAEDEKNTEKADTGGDPAATPE